MATVLLACAGSGYAAAGGVKGPVCIPVDGTVTSVPLLNCNDVPPQLTGPGFLPDGGPTPVCFRIEGKGKAKFSGYSRLTSAAVRNPAAPGTVTATPLEFPFDPVRAYINVFTSSAVLTGKMVTGRSGTLFTQDTGVITPDVDGQMQIVGQLLKIAGGTDDFDAASGIIAVAGDEVGGAAFYTGQVCVKAK